MISQYYKQDLRGGGVLGGAASPHTPVPARGGPGGQAQPLRPSRRGRAPTSWWRAAGPPSLSAGRRPRISCY